MFEVKNSVPDIDTYLRLRDINGLSPRSRQAAELGLPNSLFAVTVFEGPDPIGMGRVIGDGGCNFEIVDVAVDPAYQGKGIGRTIMEAIMGYLDKSAPDGAYISMIADEPEFYYQFGFKRCSPDSEGMFIRK